MCNDTTQEISGLYTTDETETPDVDVGTENEDTTNKENEPLVTNVRHSQQSMFR